MNSKLSKCNVLRRREETYADDTGDAVRSKKLAKNVEYLPFERPRELSRLVSFA